MIGEIALGVAVYKRESALLYPRGIAKVRELFAMWVWDDRPI